MVAQSKLTLFQVSGKSCGVGGLAGPDRYDYGEMRYRGVGLLNGRLHVLVFTETETGIRVISLRKANTREVRLYEQATQP